MIGCAALGKQVGIIKAMPGSTQKTKRMSLSCLNPEWARVHSYGENQIIRIKARLASSHSKSDALPGTAVTNAPTACHSIAIILFSRGTTTGRRTQSKPTPIVPATGPVFEVPSHTKGAQILLVPTERFMRCWSQVWGVGLPSPAGQTSLILVLKL